MSNRNYSNIGDYKIIVDGGKVVVQGQTSALTGVSTPTPLEINQRDNTPASIGFTFAGATDGYVGVNDGSFRFGNDSTIPFEVFHQNRLPRLLDEIDTTGVDDFLGARTDNVLFVSENGIDANSGETLNFSKRTIKSALDKANQLQAAALSAGKPRPPITIFVKSGNFTENNPMIVNRNVSIWGDSLRSTFVSPRTRPFQTKPNFSALEAIDPNPLVANPGEFVVTSGELLAAKTTLQADVVEYVNTLPGPIVSDKCGRDVGFIIDAVAEDLIEGGNARTAKAALAYFRFRSDVLEKDKITQIVAALEYLIDEVSSVLTAGAGKDVALALISAVKDTIANPVDFVKRATVSVTVSDHEITAINIIDGGFGYREDPKPSALFDAIANPGTFVQAPELIRLNRSFIQAEVGAFVETNFPNLLTPEQLALCKRDSGFIVDGLVLDLLTSQRPLIENQNQANYVGRFTGGNNYAVDDTITLNNGDIITVNTISGGDPLGPVTGFTVSKVIGLAVTSVSLSQRLVTNISSNATGSGFTITPAVSNLTNGSKNSQEVALTYFDNALSVLPGNQVAPTQAAISFIGTLAKQIIRQDVISVSNTDGVTQVRSSVLITPDPEAVDTIIDELVAGINVTIENPVFPATILMNDILRENIGDTETAGTFTPGTKYIIVSQGTTNFTAIGAEDNFPGTVFVATGAGSGTGTARTKVDPAIIEFEVTNNSLSAATIIDAGNGLPNGEIDISLELPYPDDGYDLFYVNNGSYYTGMTFNNLSGQAAAAAFDPLRRDPLTPPIVKGVGTTSPYIQNCSCVNLNQEGGIGMKIDGKHVGGLRSMVCDSFTQINKDGIGVYLSNRGYAQLVSIFTVSTNIGILAESGGFCSVSNSNSSFGNFGLVSRGVSELLDDGEISGDLQPFDTVITVGDLDRRPAFGDAVLFNYLYDGEVPADGQAEFFTTTVDTAGSFEIGRTYTIVTAETTDFTLIGAANSDFDTVFTATGVGTGTGTAKTETEFEISAADDNRIEIYVSDDTFEVTDIDDPAVRKLKPHEFVVVERGPLTISSEKLIETKTQVDYINGINPGRGYTVGNILTLSNGDVVTVGNVDGDGGVTVFTITKVNGIAGPGIPLVATGGTGVEFFLLPLSSNLEPLTRLILTQNQELYNDTGSRGTFNGGSGYVLNDEIILLNGDTIKVDDVDGNGAVTEFTVIAIGGAATEGFELRQSVVTVSEGSGFTLTPKSDNLKPVIDSTTEIKARLKKYYTVDSSTDLETRSATITLDLGLTQKIPGNQFVSSTVEFYQRSLITTSSHTFEYVGSGTNYFEAVPAAGGIPIRENEIVQDDDLGGQVFFTSTDDKGDFKIGPELTINRNTGTISGEAFERSLFAIITPFILSLES